VPLSSPTTSTSSTGEADLALPWEFHGVSDIEGQRTRRSAASGSRCKSAGYMAERAARLGWPLTRTCAPRPVPALQVPHADQPGRQHHRAPHVGREGRPGLRGARALGRMDQLQGEAPHPL
jgi:hypothetical protein